MAKSHKLFPSQKDQNQHHAMPSDRSRLSNGTFVSHKKKASVKMKIAKMSPQKASKFRDDIHLAAVSPLFM